MRFVAVKSAEQQSVLMLHRSRALMVRQRTMLVNAIRAHMAELGIVARVGLPQVKALPAVIGDEDDERIRPLARRCLQGLVRQLMSLEREILAAERRIHAWHRSNEVSRRLETNPGIGPIMASALAATITDPSVFKSGRELAAWIGLVPRQASSGGKVAFRDALDNLGAALPPGFDITSIRQIGDNAEVVSIVEWKSDKVPGGSQLAVPFRLIGGKVYEERWFVDTEQWKAAF